MLGCGASAGVPLIGGEDGSGDWGACDPAEPRNRRTRASILIESATGERLLVDTAPDLRMQLLACRVPKVDALLFTHAHADHITGLDDVRILNRIAGRPLDAFATHGDADRAHTPVRLRLQTLAASGIFPPGSGAARDSPRRDLSGGRLVDPLVHSGSRLHGDAWSAPRQLRVFDGRGQSGRDGVRGPRGRGDVDRRLLPALQAASDPRASGKGAGLGGAVSAPAGPCSHTWARIWTGLGL